jgi:sodium-dependent dicarboxylate transporter 2/3/5
MIFGVPLAFILVWTFWKYLCSKSIQNAEKLDLSFLNDEPNHLVPLRDKWTVIFTMAVTILLWSTESIHGIPLAATSAVPIVILTLTRIISAENVRSLPWDTLMLVAGGLALGLAIVDVGLASSFIQQLTSSSMPLWVLAFLFGYITLGVSNVMSNTAAAAILIPMALGLDGIYQIAVPLIVALSAGCALFLPVSTPPNAIAFSTDLLEQKDFRIGGFYFLSLGPALIFPIAIGVAYLLSLGFSI